jgi:uncharacterized membrane protein YcaP (DUF421 family)
MALDPVLDLFRIEMPVWELVFRGSAIYLTLFAIFRFVVHRDVGAVGIADILVLVLVADAAQNAMAGGYRTVSEGVVLVATLIGWNVLLDWLAWRFPAFARFAQAPSLLLVRDGRYLHRNLRREFVTVDDLRAKLRASGVDDVRQVAKAYLESDGEITVVRKDDRRPSLAKARARTAPK